MQQHLFFSLFLSLLCFAILRVLDVKLTFTIDRENIFTACCQAQVHFYSLKQQMWNFAHSWTVRTGSMSAASWLHARIPVLPKTETWKAWTQIWGWEERAPQAVHNSSQPVSCSSSTNGFSPGIRFLLPLCWWIKPACTPTASRMLLFSLARLWARTQWIAEEFLIFTVDVITCSSCCYHRNHKIQLKTFINNFVTWLWFW